MKTAKVLCRHIEMLLAVASLFVTILFGIHSCDIEPRKELSFSYDDILLLDQKGFVVPNLSIAYEGVDIDKFTITTITFLNSGNQTIRADDIPASAPIRIKPKDGFKMLDSREGMISNPNCGYSLTEGLDNDCVLAFDYLDPGDEIELVLFHTGDITSLEIECVIKGGKFIDTKHAKNQYDDSPFLFGFLAVIISFFIMASISINESMNYVDVIYQKKVKHRSFVVLASTLVIVLVFWGYAYRTISVLLM